jgi:hypothetical protein
MPQTLYPRGTLKKIIKAHANRPLSKNVDILVRYPHHQPTSTSNPHPKTTPLHSHPTSPFLLLKLFAA